LEKDKGIAIEMDIKHYSLGHAVAQLVEAFCYKPQGSVPDGVTGIFH
jgi:hypothetical protein